MPKIINIVSTFLQVTDYVGDFSLTRGVVIKRP